MSAHSAVVDVWICKNCERSIGIPRVHKISACPVCDGEMVIEREVGLTENQKLRELVEQWREIGTDKRLSQDHAENGKGEALEQCADELEKIINHD